MTQGPRVKLYRSDGSEEILGDKEEIKKPENPKVKVNWSEGSVTLDPAKEEAKPKKDPGTKIVVPESIERIILKQAEIYRKRNVLCNQNVELSLEAPQAERKIIVDEIRSLTAEYNRLAEIKRTWEKTGVIKEVEVKKEISGDKLELYRRKVNLGKNLSKVRANLKRYQGQPDKVHKYKMQIEKLEAELREIESQYLKAN